MDPLGSYYPDLETRYVDPNFHSQEPVTRIQVLVPGTWSGTWTRVPEFRSCLQDPDLGAR